MKISLDDIKFHPLSFIDRNGRLFFLGGQLYRAITCKNASLYKQLFDEGFIQQLIEKKLLVETDIASIEIEGFPYILQHRNIPFVSYPHEWCASMLKDAALVILNLEIALTAHNLSLQDAHPWNVLFDGSEPFFVDFGSIGSAAPNSLWVAYDEFCRLFLNPLLLMAHGHSRVAHWLLHDFRGVLEPEVKALTNQPPRKDSINVIKETIRPAVVSMLSPSLRRMLRRILPKTEPQYTVAQRLQFLRQLKTIIEQISPPTPKTAWSNYYDNAFPEFCPSPNWSEKRHNVFKVLKELQPGSVLDIGSNSGWYSLLAATQASTVIAFDTDETCISQLYQYAKQSQVPILPLMMDIRNPTPTYGLGRTSATDRFQCDMVFALALVHHLVFTYQLRFDQIASNLSAFSKHSLLVEFIPREDKYVREWWTEDFSWYTLDNFVQSLRQHFPYIRLLPSTPRPRLLILCEK